MVILTLLSSYLGPPVPYTALICLVFFLSRPCLVPSPPSWRPQASNLAGFGTVFSASGYGWRPSGNHFQCGTQKVIPVLVLATSRGGWPGLKKGDFGEQPPKTEHRLERNPPLDLHKTAPCEKALPAPAPGQCPVPGPAGQVSINTQLSYS